MFITLKRLDFKDNEGKGNKYQGLKSILKLRVFKFMLTIISCNSKITNHL